MTKSKFKKGDWVLLNPKSIWYDVWKNNWGIPNILQVHRVSKVVAGSKEIYLHFKDKNCGNTGFSSRGFIKIKLTKALRLLYDI